MFADLWNVHFHNGFLLLSFQDKVSMRIGILLPFPLSLPLSLSLKLQQSGKIGGKLAIYQGKRQFYMHMYLPF